MTRQTILEEAIKCVTKDRNATHGDPEDNFQIIADLWNTYLYHKIGMGLSKEHIKTMITAEDIATMMILMKISRTISSPTHQDHWIDIAGYAACGGEIATKENK